MTMGWHLMLGFFFRRELLPHKCGVPIHRLPHECGVPIRLVSERRVHAAAPSRCHGRRSYSSRHRALPHRHALRSATQAAFTGLFSV